MKQRSHPALLALLGYLGLTLLLMAPVLPHFAEAIPGGAVAAVDGWQHVWHVWWTHRAIAAGQSPLFTPLLYHPTGVNLAVHPLNLSNGLLALPATALAGPIAGFNLAALLAFPLCGLGAYLLAREAGASPGPAFLGGLVLSFGPFHLTKFWDGQLELIALQWLPLYALFLLRSVSRPGPRDPLLAGLMLALVGYTSLYYLLFAAAFSPLFVLLWAPWRAGWPALAGWAGRAALAAAAAALLMLPLLLPIAASAGEVAPSPGISPLLIARSANLLDFLLPSYLHPLWGGAVAGLGPRWHPGIAAWNVALGYTALALAGAALLLSRPAAWRWALIALAGAALALGPRLSVGDIQTGLPGPYAALLGLPGMRLSQRPGHFAVLTVLALVPLAALGLEALLARLRPAARPALLAAAAALLAIEYAVPPPPLQRPAADPAYQGLAGQPGALFVLPEQKGQIRSLQEQLVHGRPIMGGYLARIPEHTIVEQTPVLGALWRLAPEPQRLLPPADASPAMVLRAYDIGALVVHWDRMSAEQRELAAAVLGQALPGQGPAQESGATSVYAVPPGPVQPFGFYAGGWYAQERDGARSWRWMAGAASLTLVNPGDAPARVRLGLEAGSYGAARTVELRLGEAPLVQWTVPAQPETGAIQIELLLPPGRHDLTLSAPADAAADPRGPISIALTGAELRP